MKCFLRAALLLATGAILLPAYQLGINYSEWLGFAASGQTQLAVDGSANVYLLTSTFQGGSTVTKISADGKTILWQNQPGFTAVAMALDSGGGVYVVPARLTSDTVGYVAKLNSSGTGLAWQAAVGFLPQSQPVIAADSQGRVYFAANNSTTRTTDVVRINPAGSGIDFTTQFAGTPTAIALDSSGAAYVEGGNFLAKVTSDGTVGYYDVMSANQNYSVAVDAKGNVVLFGSGDGNSGLIQHVDPTGGVTLTATVPGAISSFALDGAGNAYVTAYTNQLYPVKNSLATCGSSPGYIVPLLNVIAPDGSILQSTYVPGAANGAPLAAVTPNGTVFMAIAAGTGFVPTQAGPYPAGVTGYRFLANLSASNSVTTYPLACVGNSASFDTRSISPGEIVSLFGNGLGPQQGVQAQVVAGGSFPKILANAQVSFDGTMAPLLWVQDGQINAVAPFALTPGGTTQVCVIYNGATTNCLSVPVVPTTPAVYMADQIYAAALNQDGTLNSAKNPAAVGSIVTVWATGLGTIAPVQPDGSMIGLPLPTNTLPFHVKAAYGIGLGVGPGTEYEVEYAGPAPTLVAGASQINFKLSDYPPYGEIQLYTGSSLSRWFSIHMVGQ